MTTPALAVPVKGKGRHYQNPITKDLVPSVTNIIGILDKPAIPRWAARVVAEQAADLKESLLNLEREEIVDLLKGSPWRSSTRAATRGTSIHELVEAMIRGTDLPEITGEAVTFQKAVEDFLNEVKVEPLYTEVTGFGDGYAGTCDFVGTFDGRPTIADWKTGKDLYPEVALQLAALSQVEFWVPDESEVVEWADQVDLVAVLFTAKGWKAKKVADPGSAYAAFLSLLDAWGWVYGDTKPLVDFGAAPTPAGR